MFLPLLNSAFFNRSVGTSYEEDIDHNSIKLVFTQVFIKSQSTQLVSEIQSRYKSCLSICQSVFPFVTPDLLRDEIWSEYVVCEPLHVYRVASFYARERREQILWGFKWKYSIRIFRKWSFLWYWDKRGWVRSQNLFEKSASGERANRQKPDFNNVLKSLKLLSCKNRGGEITTEFSMPI